MLSVTLAVPFMTSQRVAFFFFLRFKVFQGCFSLLESLILLILKLSPPPITSCCLQVGVPGAAERADILQKQLSSVSCSATADELTRVADDAHGYVGADLAAVCKEAGKWS